MDLVYCRDQLSKAGVRFDNGLTSIELVSIERRHGFVFPPDLREFLSFALPVSTGWVDWRHGSRADIQARLNWPYEGMCFDIQHNAFWLTSWGQKPSVFREACAIARKAVDAAPRLVPVFGHR